MSVKTNALSNFPTRRPSDNATLLWSMYLDNTQVVGARTSYDDGVNPQDYYDLANITGVDSNGHGITTADAAMGTSGAGTTVLQHFYIRDGDRITTTPAFEAEYSSTVRASTFGGGAGNERELVQLQRVNTEWADSRPQAGLQLVLKNDTTCRDTIYITYLFEVPDNIDDILARPTGGGWTLAWWELDAVKCGSSTATNDCRFAINLGRVDGETGIRARAQKDNLGIHPLTGAPVTISSLDDGTLPTPYDQTDEGFITPGQYQLEYYIKRSASRADLDTGRYRVVMTRLDTGERAVVCDYVGGQYWGYYGFDMTRFFHGLIYTGGYPDTGNITLKISNLEYWDRPPSATFWN